MAKPQPVEEVVIATIVWGRNVSTPFVRVTYDSGNVKYGYPETDPMGQVRSDLNHWLHSLRTNAEDVQPSKEACTPEEWHDIQTMRLLKSCKS